MNQIDQPSGASVVLLWRSVGPYHLARARAAAQRLAPRGIRVVAVELSEGEETRDWRVDRANAGCEVLTVSQDATLTDGSADQSPKLLKLLDRLQPKGVAIAGYDRPEMRRAFRWANRNEAASVLMSETKADDRARPWWKRMLIAREIRRADAALVSGAAAGEYLVSLGMPREKVFRHYGAVDNAYFREHACERRSGDPRVFLACCRLIESRKNIRTLVWAYETYCKKTPKPWELVICGDGPDRRDYEALVSQEQIDGVTFAGFQQVDALAGYYARAGCFVHPAKNEAWGLVVNEALASGLPVLVSRRCGCAYDLVHEGINGYTFDPGEPAELAEMLSRISEMPAVTRAEMGAESLRIVSRFGCEAFAAGLEQALDSTWGKVLSTLHSTSAALHFADSDLRPETSRATPATATRVKT